jgi:hypothetical protein
MYNTNIYRNNFFNDNDRIINAEPYSSWANVSSLIENKRQEVSVEVRSLQLLQAYVSSSCIRTQSLRCSPTKTESPPDPLCLNHQRNLNYLFVYLIFYPIISSVFTPVAGVVGSRRSPRAKEIIKPLISLLHLLALIIATGALHCYDYPRNYFQSSEIAANCHCRVRAPESLRPESSYYTQA